MYKKDTKKKILLIILDGLSDRPQEKMRGRTPLQAAHTPTLDFLAKIGAVGRLQAYKPGIPPHSDLALFSILGYSDRENPSRSIFEALGKNVPLKEKDVVVSVSYDRVVKINNHLYVKKSEVDLPEDTLARITEKISSFVYKDIKLRLYYTGKSYGTLIIENGSSHITDTDPFSKRLPVLKCLPLEGYNDPKTIATAEAINKYLVWVYENLKGGEANFILTKWAGTYRQIQPFSQRHGLKGISFSPKRTINGLIHYLGMEYVNTNGMTFSEVVEKGIQNLKTFDFLHLHTIEPDHCSHLKDPHRKTRAIQAIDQALVPLKNLGGETVLAISADHTGPSTPGTLRHRHAGDPTPLLIVGSNVLKDDVKVFSERSCRKGGLGTVNGKDLLPILLDYADRTINQKRRLLPTKHTYLPDPDQVTPLEVA